MQQKAPSKDKNRRAADRGGERGNVSVIVFGAFSQWPLEEKLGVMGTERRDWCTW